MKVIAFWSGHYGKDKNEGGARPESGACDVDGICEADWTPDVCLVAALEARRRGRTAHALTLGDYHEREGLLRGHETLAIHVHGDAGGHGKDETGVFYWPGNVAGYQLAQSVAAELRGVVPWPVVVREATPAWDRVRRVLASNAGTSVLVEVGFVDGILGHVQLPQLAPVIGGALGRAV